MPAPYHVYVVLTHYNVLPGENHGTHMNDDVRVFTTRERALSYAGEVTYRPGVGGGIADISDDDDVTYVREDVGGMHVLCVIRRTTLD